MSFTQDLDPNIIQEISEDYQKAAFWLPFSAIEIKKVFDLQQFEELGSFMSEIKAATASNKKKTDVIKKYSDVVFKLLEMAKVVA